MFLFFIFQSTLDESGLNKGNVRTKDELWTVKIVPKRHKALKERFLRSHLHSTIDGYLLRSFEQHDGQVAEHFNNDPKKRESAFILATSTGTKCFVSIFVSHHNTIHQDA